MFRPQNWLTLSTCVLGIMLSHVGAAVNVILLLRACYPMVHLLDTLREGLTLLLLLRVGRASLPPIADPWRKISSDDLNTLHEAHPFLIPSYRDASPHHSLYRDLGMVRPQEDSNRHYHSLTMMTLDMHRFNRYVDKLLPGCILSTCLQHVLRTLEGFRPE